MITLPLERIRKGFTYRQVKRVANCAIYSQHDHPRSVPGAYEVIIIRSHDDYVIAGVTIPAAETYPGTGAFGSLAWTYSCHLYSPTEALKLALDKLGQVVESEERRITAKLAATESPIL